MSDLSAPAQAQEDGIFVQVTSDSLDIVSTISKVRSPKAGAIVSFLGPYVEQLAAGTTRDSFESRPVTQLAYSAYTPLAIQTMTKIARDVMEKHSLVAVAMVHRLGNVPIGEDSILIAVSAPHRAEAWRGGEEALELCKEKVEIWKLEEFGDVEEVWRANRDGKRGVPVSKREENESTK